MAERPESVAAHDRPRVALPRVIVVMGVSGSGKTTLGRALADTLGYRFEDADDHHPPANVEKMRAGRPLIDTDRVPWLNTLRCLITTTLDRPEVDGLVLACSALKRSYRRRLAQPGEPIRFVFLDVPRDELIRRLDRRTAHFFNPALLDDQLATLEPPGADEALRVGAIDVSPDAAAAAVVDRLTPPRRGT